MGKLRERQKADREKRILSAAVHKFRANGYKAVRIEDLAEAAEVSVGTVYNYYGTKGDILIAIVTMEVEEVLAEGQALVDNPPEDPGDALLALTFCYYDHSLNYLTKEKFSLPHLDKHVSEGTNIATSIGSYFSTMLDQSMNWKDAEDLCAKWGGQFALKGVMSVEDAKRAVDIGCTGIMVSNHGGRQLDGSRAPFDQLAEICDAVGDKIEDRKSVV